MEINRGEIFYIRRGGRLRVVRYIRSVRQSLSAIKKIMRLVILWKLYT